MFAPELVECCLSICQACTHTISPCLILFPPLPPAVSIPDQYPVPTLGLSTYLLPENSAYSSWLRGMNVVSDLRSLRWAKTSMLFARPLQFLSRERALFQASDHQRRMISNFLGFRVNIKGNIGISCGKHQKSSHHLFIKHFLILTPYQVASGRVHRQLKHNLVDATELLKEAVKA